MKILVLNCGSSSVKYQLFDMEDETVLAKGLVERIGINNSILEQETITNGEFTIEEDIENHDKAIKMVIDALLDEEHGVLENMDEIKAVGHRVVHGGEKFASSTIIDQEVIDKIEEVSDLAPLHNPPNLIGINVCSKMMPSTPQIGVFDTAFHQTMPEKAYIYPIPYEYYKKYGIRRYGFHGTSHKYVSHRAAKLMGKKREELKIITCHLGNGASIAAIKEGKSVDTSMGLTPLEGLMMGTRCGDIDPAIIPYLVNKENLSVSKIDETLNKKSGILGVSGVSNDMRDIAKAANSGNFRAALARKIFIYRVQKYIGAYTAAMNGVDVIVFTGGIGENSTTIRAEIIANFSYLNINIDEEANKVKSKEAEITTQDAGVKVFVIPTNEELVIARDTAELIKEKI